VLVQADMDVARQDAGSLAEAGASVTPLGPGSFDSTSAEKRLSGCLRRGIAGCFGRFRARSSALGALSDYLEITQKGACRSSAATCVSSDAAMQIDVATRRNLELTKPVGRPAGEPSRTCSTGR
jgi:DNA mismatch repair protein MutS